MLACMNAEPQVLTSNEVVRIVLCGKLFAVRWKQTPTANDLHRLKDQLITAAKGTPDIIYVGMSDEAMGVPDKELQRTMTKNTFAMLSYVSEFNLVLTGTSLKATMSRTFFRGMATAARLGHRVAGIDVGGVPVRKLAIFDTPLAFAQNTSARLGLAAPAFMEFLSRNGLAG